MKAILIELTLKLLVLKSMLAERITYGMVGGLLNSYQQLFLSNNLRMLLIKLMIATIAKKLLVEIINKNA